MVSGVGRGGGGKWGETGQERQEALVDDQNGPKEASSLLCLAPPLRREIREGKSDEDSRLLAREAHSLAGPKFDEENPKKKQKTASAEQRGADA